MKIQENLQQVHLNMLQTVKSKQTPTGIFLYR